MDIKYKSEGLRKLCLEQAEAKRKHGADCARKLRSRYADLEAAKVVADLVAGNPHPLDRDRDGQFALDLAGGKRITFVPDHKPIPRNTDGKIDWSKVTKICIVYIGDYHD